MPSCSRFYPSRSKQLLGGLVFSLSLVFGLSAQTMDAVLEQMDFLPPQDAAVVAEQLPGAEVLRGGIRFIETRAGSGPFIRSGDRVEAIYEGRLLDGTVFNRKTGRFHTYRFTVGAEPRQVIRGWEIASERMQAGGRYVVAIPAQFAYQDRGRRGQVPPYSTVIFEIEILGVTR